MEKKKKTAHWQCINLGELQLRVSGNWISLAGEKVLMMNVPAGECSKMYV